MTQSHQVTYGYLPNFKGDAVVLFVGDRLALEGLAKFLETLVEGPLNITAILDAEPLFIAKRGMRLTLTVTDSTLGLKRISAGSAEPRFEWRISKGIALSFAELIRAVALADRPSHQYLDTEGNDEVTVIVSKGEYDEAWLLEVNQRNPGHVKNRPSE